MNRLLRPLAAVAGIALALAAFTAGDLTSGRIAPAAAQAAPPAGGPGPAGAAAGRMRFGKMLMSLNLSPDQTTQIRTIMANARAKAKSQTDRQAKRDTMRGAFKDIEGVLTPAQRAKLQSERDAYRAQHGGNANRS